MMKKWHTVDSVVSMENGTPNDFNRAFSASKSSTSKAMEVPCAEGVQTLP
jgi:hypothetical protein